MPNNEDSKSEYVPANRAYWDEQAASYAERGRRSWAGEPCWGIWDVPETQAAGDRLLRPQRGMHRFEWSDTAAIEFHVSPGDWIRLLRANAFEVEDLIELSSPQSGAENVRQFRQPCEELELG